MKGPSNKVAGVLIAVVLIVTGTIIFQLTKESLFPKDKETVAQKNLEIQIDNKTGNTDSDGDGLTDWEESLWKTDPNNPDTDGDGTSDGEEVSNNRNPLVPGPNDKILSQQELAENYQVGETDPNSLTSAIARNLFENIALQNQNGGISNEDAKKLAESLTLNAAGQIKLPEKYSPNQLITFDSSDKDRLKEYGNLFVSTQINELQKSLLDSENNSQYLDKLISTYEVMAQQVFLLQVPQELANTHTQIANNLYKISIIIKGINNEQDPFLAMLYIPHYEKVGQDIDTLTEQVANFIKQSGIIFNEEEQGNLLYAI